MKHSSPFKWFLLTVLLSALPLTATAYDFMVDGLCYNYNSDGATVSVTYETTNSSHYSSLSGDLVIPETVSYNNKSYIVSMIGKEAFVGCLDLTTIVIPNTVTSIGEKAFSTCRKVTRIIIPNSVLYMESCAFQDCSSLDSLIIPNSVSMLSDRLFLGCIGLKNIKLPTSIKSIGSSTFHTCVNLTNIDIPNSVVSIGGAAFYQCIGLENVIIPESVTSIGNGAFANCSNLISVNIPNAVTSIGSQVFVNTAIYNNHPDGVFYVDKWVCGFKGHYYDSNIHLKSNTRGIADNAFEDKHFTSIEIPDSVAIIGKYAFYRCKDLVSISIPNSVTSIGMLAFAECTNLTNIDFPIPNMLSFMGLEVFYDTPWYNNQSDGIVYLGDWICRYKGVMYYDTSLSIRNGTKGIAESAFANCMKLDSITIPNTVTYICNYAFSYCEGLRSIYSTINAPDNVSMGADVFYGVPKETCMLHVPKGTKDLYMNADQWKDFLNIIDDIEEPVSAGDVNGDGKVNVSDVSTLINMILGITEKDEQLADVNGDGRVNVSDVTALINIILGIQ